MRSPAAQGTGNPELVSYTIEGGGPNAQIWSPSPTSLGAVIGKVEGGKDVTIVAKLSSSGQQVGHATAYVKKGGASIVHIYPDTAP